MSQIKAVLKVFLSRVMGFLIFLILLGIVNVLAYYIPNETFGQIVGFLNDNIQLIILFTIVLMIGEIFGALIFPFNLPSPLFNAIGAVFLVRFILDIFEFLNSILNLRIPFNFYSVYLIASLIVFIIVAVFGYLKIFSNLIPSERKKKRDLTENK